MPSSRSPTRIHHARPRRTCVGRGRAREPEAGANERDSNLSTEIVSGDRERRPAHKRTSSRLTEMTGVVRGVIERVRAGTKELGTAPGSSDGHLPCVGTVANLVMGMLVIPSGPGFVPNSGVTMNDHGQVVSRQR